jgi:hypothetical protein
VDAELVQSLLNQRFDVSAIKMRNLGVFNPEYGVDNRMFVDPKLLENAKEEFAGAHDDLHAYFRKTIAACIPRGL